MTCNACGEKPKNAAKDFTKAVIEINNPETLVLLRKVVIPASMGTEEQVPAAIGKYHNVILKYEANKHVYLYSSDGIPTLIEIDVPQELWDRIEDLEDGLSNLEEEFDEFKNSPDVVDIVATYSDLQAYDTSSLGDKDIIRVLADETHNGESTYYRWDLNTHTWNYIGAVGPYYTKDQTDNLLNEKQDSLTAGENITIENNVISADDWIVTLTSDDYDYPDNNPDGIALWKLPTGMYIAPTDIKTYYDSSSSGTSGSPRVTFINSDLVGSDCVIFTPGPSVSVQVVNKNTGNTALDTSILLSSQVVDVLTSTATGVPLSANQGKVLKDAIDALPVPPTVVQTTGTSTTDVMSQNATTSMVYSDPETKKKIVIGGGTIAGATEPVAIGRAASVRGNYAVAIGSSAGSQATNAPGGISLGAFSKAAGQGQMDISLVTATSQTQAACGYNGSEYRLLTGLYDPQNAHDAATKGYVDPITGSSAPTTSTSGDVGKIYIDTSTDTAYMCVNVSGSTYTWKQITN